MSGADRDDATNMTASSMDPQTRIRFLRRAQDRRATRVRRGVALLTSLFTMGNNFCGYACIVFSFRHDFEIAALFIGVAIVLDMLDGRIARLTGTTSAFGM